MQSTRTARLFVGLNAAFSAVTGLCLLVFTDEVQSLLFRDSAWWQIELLTVLGVGLVGFSLFLLMLVTDRFVTRLWVNLVVLADIGWILMTGLVVITTGGIFNSTGLLTVGIVALVVAVFAAGQFVGARRIVAPLSAVTIRSDGNALNASVNRTVNASVDAVWRVMTDHPAYADVANNIARVEVLSGNGLGMIRRCFDNKGDSWTETCDEYVNTRTFGFKINTAAADYPYPIADLHGRWSVEPKASGAKFSIDIDVVPEGGAIARTLFKLFAMRQFRVVLIDLAEAWALKMEHASVQ